ncbi:MAG: hypothetical protein IPG01_00140 [Chitinophagaceae bacterium]|nr:hypothetical protein [Chitinophagaceae bacterium]
MTPETINTILICANIVAVIGSAIWIGKILKTQIKSQREVLEFYSSFVSDIAPMREQYKEQIRLHLETTKIERERFDKEFIEIATFINSVNYGFITAGSLWKNAKEYEQYVNQKFPLTGHLFMPLAKHIKSKQSS